MVLRRVVGGRAVVHGVVLALALALGAAGCGDSGPAATSPTTVTEAAPDPVGMYSAAIGAAVTGVTLAEGDVVYVTMRSEHKPLALDTQAGIVKELGPDLVVRFVDDDTEAMDAGDDARPVAKGVLLRLGVVDEQRAGELLVERYRDRTHQELLVLTVARSGDAWTATITATRPVTS